MAGGKYRHYSWLGQRQEVAGVKCDLNKTIYFMFNKINLFHPFINEEIKMAAYKTLGGRIIGQGEKVFEFEKLLEKKLKIKNLLTVNSGTSALELAYHLLGLKKGDEVIVPVFTCSATSVPLARLGVKVVFADVTDELLMDWNDVKKKINSKTKAIVNVHLFGKYNKAPHLSVPIVGDACQYLGKTFGERFTAYSFQATKIITTVDGGALVCQKKSDYNRVKLLRWYGLDRETKKEHTDVDIKEAGYKYHMNNVTASMGIAGLKILDRLTNDRILFQKRYKKLIGGLGGVPYLIHVKDRENLKKELSLRGIETGLVHRRNDLHTIFGGKRLNLPNMNKLEKSFLFLPCHNKMTLKDVDYICKSINEII
jgi:perosamine synthetase